MNYKNILVVICALAMTACASRRQVVHYTYSETTTTPIPTSGHARQAQASLEESAESVSHSLQELSSIQQTVHPQAKLAKPVDPKLIGMAQIVSLDWNGPVEPLLRQIAEISHYRLHVLGKTPGVPVMVSVTAHGKPLAEVFRDVTYQVVGKAKIKLYRKRRIIELRYP